MATFSRLTFDSARRTGPASTLGLTSVQLATRTPRTSTLSLGGGPSDIFGGATSNGGGGIDLIGTGVGILEDLIRKKLGISDTPSGGTGGPTELVAQECAPGRVRIGNKCVDPGAALPGGTPFVVPAGGEAVMGVFGAPALSPTVVGEITREDGSTGVIRRCMAGLVLGKDNLCYSKGSIPNKLRKWPKDPRPPVSAFDAKMMRRYGPGGSKQRGVKKLAQEAGFTCKKR